MQFPISGEIVGKVKSVAPGAAEVMGESIDSVRCMPRITLILVAATVLLVVLCFAAAVTVFRISDVHERIILSRSVPRNE
jgi:hypothetical protein